MKVDDYPEAIEILESDADEFERVELEFLEFIDSLGLSDTVVLDFNDELRGDSAIVVSFTNLKEVKSAIDHNGHIYTFNCSIYGVWKVDDMRKFQDALTGRNEAFVKLLKVLTELSLGIFHVKLVRGDKNMWQSQGGDMRFFFGFEIGVEIKFIVR